MYIRLYITTVGTYGPICTEKYVHMQSSMHIKVVCMHICEGFKANNNNNRVKKAKT